MKNRKHCKICATTGKLKLPDTERNVKTNKKTKEAKTVISPRGHVSWTETDNYNMRVRKLARGPSVVNCPFCEVKNKQQECAK